MAERLLLVDDDGAFRAVYRQLLVAEGYAVSEAGSVPEAEAVFARTDARLVILDLMLPPSGRTDAGVALCDRMLALRPDAKVVVVSGAGETRVALGVVQRGAYDFLAKPVDPDVLLAVVARASARLALEDRVRELETSLVARHAGSDALLGSSAPFVEARTLCERAAPTEVPVLITGESGTGKEVFARYLHARSGRRDGPFVAVNCGALAATLLESTLFGHRRGAFTGATADAPGLFVRASGGTLFLDELGDMEPALQVKLLRVLESGEVLPVGASTPVHADVRIVSATHRPLDALRAAGSFRDDLYWRVRGIEIALPRLADRTGDLPVLAQHFLNVSRALVPQGGAATLSPGALRRMEQYAWPGNLRELRHEMQRARVMAVGRSEILEDDLSPSLRAPTTPRAASTVDAGDGGTLEQKIAALEQREIRAALDSVGGNRSQAATRLGLSRQGLLNKMERYGMRG